MFAQSQMVSSTGIYFLHTVILLKYCYLSQIILFNINNNPWWRFNSSIWCTDGTLTNTTISGQIVPGSKGNEKVQYIPQSHRTGASPPDCLVSYFGHSLDVGWGSYSLCRNAVDLFYSLSWQSLKFRISASNISQLIINYLTQIQIRVWGKLKMSFF